ncbi:MAG: formate--phosphoribosylaminoimidazolecarboxamide ligase family protein [Thermoplasmata archaeon]
MGLKEDLRSIIADYEQGKIKIGAIASHSALDIFDGAIEEGFETVAFCQKGREKTYTKYFKAYREGNVIRGVVDHYYVYEKFADMLNEIEKLQSERIVIVPNRALSSYIPLDIIENTLTLPIFGNRRMLRIEEREEEKNYYWLLERAGIQSPEKVDKPEKIDALVMVKLPHAKKRLERGFFTAASFEEYSEKVDVLLKTGVITKEDLKTARIERYIIGPVFNLNFFYSPISTGPGLELLGIDWRFETSLDGHVRLPANQQLTLNEKQKYPEYTVCGHNSATLRESLLEKAFEIGEKFVEASQKYYPPGIIGPFCLQTCVDKDLNFYVYDVAPRIGGGTNVHMNVGHPYGNALWHERMSTGRRIAREIRIALEKKKLELILT